MTEFEELLESVAKLDCNGAEIQVCCRPYCRLRYEAVVLVGGTPWGIGGETDQVIETVRQACDRALKKGSPWGA